MLVLLALPLVLSVVLGRVAPAFARRHSPRPVAISLVGVSLATALATGLVLCAVAVLALAEVPAIARVGHWSAASLHAHAGVPIALGCASALLALVLIASSVWRVVCGIRQFTKAARTCRELDPAALTGGLVVLDDPRADAYAVPGRAGRVVITRGLLRRLDGAERRAVLVHEQSHLQHRHFLYVQLAELSACADPLLRPVAEATRLAVERWADEDAARAVADRRTVARALAKAGLARSEAAVPIALAIAETDLAVRVRSLVEPTRGARPRCAVTLLSCAGVVALAGAVCFGVNAHELFEAAQAVYSAHRG